MRGEERQRLAPLYPILDVEMAAACGHDLLACARGFAGLGLEVQQLRAKNLPAGEFLRLAGRLVEVVPRLIINDRADIALLAGAAGVHVGQDDLPLEAVRDIGSDWIIGVSTHNLDQAALAALAQPSYWALGPIFATSSKLKPDPVVGVQRLAEVRAGCPGTLVAIGGIGLENCASVWRAGADAVAVISALWRAKRPVAAAEEFLLAFQHVSCHSPGD